MRRLFVALALPDPIRDLLAALQGGLDGARWVDPDNLHLTLRFIGEVDRGTAEDLEAALSGVRAPGFDLALKGFGHFERSGRPRALWVGVASQPLLGYLKDRVEAATRRAGLPPEGRRFTPHVTLARLDGSGGPALSAWIAERSPFASGAFAVREATLFRSFLGHEGPRYEPDAAIPLDRLPDCDDWDGEWPEEWGDPGQGMPA